MVNVKQSRVTGRGSRVKIVYLGLGTNLGNKKKNIKEAIRLLRRETKVLKVSSFYKTKPVGYLDQPDFLNAVAEIKTSLTPLQLLKQVKVIEKSLGRIKSVHWGPRLIDIDILLYNNKIIRTKKLVIPHLDLERRWFILKPLTEIAPEMIHPVLKKKIKDLLAVIEGQ
ncbi:MAG: 2-amino-4-hydroxy-6-hydroxymethyldihydropteridine diphosphokinase [bacterium]|nr:2-amino-4-hydroxy-6-hydroxymethyldihydropteridine diphosphokinase [bacterium]MDD5354534.1 2-amino-4-hydroxy-6-hydroxymethyldihydropteridine diphosphokinase [bacterium]MDD5756769.1 2-amino-4-hydroxy-6-hydroxymethyldihydropteridine diphosphokinase [bacterium]